MPGSYAHFALGCRCLEELPERLKNRLLKNEDMFFAGLHGPDIFFYYRPLLPNRITKSGHILHSEDPREFIANGKYLIRHTESRRIKEKEFAYLCGFLCHYYLDSICHGFISRQKHYMSFYHYRIERAFDRRLLEICSDYSEAFSRKFHIDATAEDCRIIAGFYPGITPVQIMTAVKGHRSFCGINNFFEEVTGINSRSGKRISTDTASMEMLFGKALKRSVRGIELLERYVFAGGFPSLRFRRNFKGHYTDE